MEYAVPIPTLFSQVFSLSSDLIKYYNVPLEDVHGDTIKSFDQVVSEAEVKSNLGTPVSFPMQFVASDYFVYKNDKIEKQRFEAMFLPFTAVADFRRAKNIIETPLVGGKGSVKEIFNISDWNIRIMGFMLDGEKLKSKTNGIPLTIQDQIEALKGYEEIVDSIKVGGKIFEWLGIENIVIKEIFFPTAKGMNMEKVMPFEIIAVSDEPLELMNL